MSSIIVTAAQLIAKAAELSTRNAQFKQQVTSLDEKEQSLSSMWEGETRNAFHNAFQRDKVQMDNFYNAIAQYINALQTIAKKYEEVENQNLEISKARKY